MRIKKYAQSEYAILSHKRFKCYFTIVKQGDYKEAHSLSIPNLTHTTISSKLLTEKVARIIGEIFIELANLLKENK